MYAAKSITTVASPNKPMHIEDRWGTRKWTDYIRSRESVDKILRNARDKSRDGRGVVRISNYPTGRQNIARR